MFPWITSGLCVATGRETPSAWHVQQPQTKKKKTEIQFAYLYTLPPGACIRNNQMTFEMSDK